MSYQAPTHEQVLEVLRRIASPPLRRAFFEGLKNPLWVAPLASEGAFDNPPEPELAEDGLVQDIYWPEIDYLIRVAVEAPGDVVDVLLRLGGSRNAWVRRGTFEVGAAIPADQAARLRPLVESWLTTGLGWRTDPRDLVSFAVNLLAGGQTRAGRWFANLIFRPMEDDQGAPTAVLEKYWYETELPRVVTALGSDGLQVVLPWLEAYERKVRHLTDTWDMSDAYRDSIRHRGDTHDGVEQALIDAVRDLAVQATRDDPARTAAALVRSKMLIARKVAMFAVADAISSANDLGNIDPLVDVARTLLSDPESAQDSCRIDFAELARATSAAVGEPLAELIEVLADGPGVDRDRLRQWLADDQLDGALLDHRVAEYIRRWRHRWLSTIGLDPLPQSLREELSALDGEFGVIDNPLVPTPRVSSWVGPSSPLGQEDMAMMRPAELMAHLETWRATGTNWGPRPSHEGHARQLSALLGTNPNSLAGIDDLVRRLRPTYVRATLTGWEAALKAGLDLDWRQVLPVVGDVLRHSDETAFQQEGGDFDDDADLRPSKRAAVGLLEEAVKKRSDRDLDEPTIAALADLLIRGADDEQAWEDYASHDGTSGMDPLTISLNWQWPVRLRGITHLMAWGVEAPWYHPARLALENELKRDDPRGASRAVIGEASARLLDSVPDWITSKAIELFGGGDQLSTGQQIALTTALAAYHYHNTLFDLLSPAMVVAIASGQPITAGWHTSSDPLQRMGEWAIEAIVRGYSTDGDRVAQAFFSNAPAEIRGSAMGHIGWTFMHASTVEDPFRDRLANLWDGRVAHVREHASDAAELSGFHWFVRSRKFAISWWLPRLREALELCPTLSTEKFLIGKELAAAAEEDPRGALEVLRLLMRADPGSRISFDLHRNAVALILGRAIATDDTELKGEAIRYMNELGEAGHLTLEAEVNRVLDGTITPADLDD